MNHRVVCVYMCVHVFLFVSVCLFVYLVGDRRAKNRHRDYAEITCVSVCLLKVKRYSSPEQVISQLRGGCHLPYGITQCYLPPNTSDEHNPP